MRISGGSREMAGGMPPADEWSDAAVSTLLDCYSDKYLELNGGSIGSKGWQDVIFKLNSVCAQGRPVYSYRRCKNKLDVMKRRFKIERDRKATNGGVSDWPWFDKMEEIVGRNPRTSSSTPPPPSAALVVANSSFPQKQQQQQHQQQQLLHPQPLHATERAPGAQNHSGVEAPRGGSLLGSSSKRDRVVVSPSVLDSGHQEDISASQLLSDQQDGDEDDEDDQARRAPPLKKRKKSTNSGSGSGGGGGGSSLRHAKEIARIVTEALERMEMKRLEVMRELELKRNETQLQIARMMIEFNSRAQQQQQQPQQHQHHQQQNNLQTRQPSSSSEPHSFAEQEQ